METAGKIMKKYILIIAVVLFAVLTPVLTGIRENKSDISAFNESSFYTVKEYGGKIGIFPEGSNAPETVLDVFVFILPETDRSMLKEGFIVDENSICGVIEDYTG